MDDTATTSLLLMPSAPFCREDPTSWFRQLEELFAACKIDDDELKYVYLQARLDPSILAEVLDFFDSPPDTRKYEELKTRIIAELADPLQQNVVALLEELALGDRTPSQLSREMTLLADGKLVDTLLRTLFLRKLPRRARLALADSEASLEEMAEIAGRMLANDDDDDEPSAGNGSARPGERTTLSQQAQYDDVPASSEERLAGAAGMTGGATEIVDPLAENGDEIHALRQSLNVSIELAVKQISEQMGLSRPTRFVSPDSEEALPEVSGMADGALEEDAEPGIRAAQPSSYVLTELKAMQPTEQVMAPQRARFVSAASEEGLEKVAAMAEGTMENAYPTTANGDDVHAMHQSSYVLTELTAMPPTAADPSAANSKDRALLQQSADEIATERLIKHLTKRVKKLSTLNTLDSMSEEYEVERIVRKRVLRSGQVQYYIKWKNYPEEHNTWEPVEHLKNSKKMINEYEAQQKRIEAQQKAKNMDDPFQQPEVSGFDQGLVPEKIVGATDKGGYINFLIKWKDTEDMELVPNHVARKHCPYLVIKFYEQNIAWDTP